MEFFFVIVDLDELECYCQVLDVEEVIYCMVEMVIKKGIVVFKLEYILDDIEREFLEDQSVFEDEMMWWQWVENVLKELI